MYYQHTQVTKKATCWARYVMWCFLLHVSLTGSSTEVLGAWSGSVRPFNHSSLSGRTSSSFMSISLMLFSGRLLTLPTSCLNYDQTPLIRDTLSIPWLSYSIVVKAIVGLRSCWCSFHDYLAAGCRFRSNSFDDRFTFFLTPANLLPHFIVVSVWYFDIVFVVACGRFLGFDNLPRGQFLWRLSFPLDGVWDKRTRW